MAISIRASLLGLPRELRLQIYDFILSDSTSFTPLNGMTGGHGKNGFYTSAMRNPDARLRLPWLGLLLTCGEIADEIQGLFRQSVDADSARTTYVMATDIGSGRGRMGAVTWRHIPCAPSDARVLVVECGCDGSPQLGGDGG